MFRVEGLGFLTGVWGEFRGFLGVLGGLRGLGCLGGALFQCLGFRIWVSIWACLGLKGV